MQYFQKHWQKLELKNRSLSFVIILIFGLITYSTVLLIGIPDVAIRFLQLKDYTLLFIATFVFLYFAYRPFGAIGILTSLCATLIVFASPLAALWRNGISESGFVMAGLITMSDADSYHTSALRLLDGNTFDLVGSWRPLSQGFIATLLSLTQQNFQLIIAFLVLITAITCFLLAREIQNSHGTLIGVLILTLIFLYYTKYIGTVATENLGLALGAIGLIGLWRGVIYQRINPCLLGIFLLTLALNTRAGAMFILPAFVLWGTWSFRKTSRLSYRFLLVGISVVLLGFIINSIVLKVTGFPQIVAYSNFSYSLYGLIVGGNWKTVIEQHPEIGNIYSPEATQKVYQLAIEALRANPFSLVSGFFRAWKQFFWGGEIFSFVENTQVTFVLQILSLITLINCYRQRQTLMASFLIAALVGIILSVPFVPPWDTGTRAYAVTIPLFSLFPALGLFFLAQKIKWKWRIDGSYYQEQTSLLWIIGLSLVVLMFVGPIAIKTFSRLPQYTEISCPLGSETAYFWHSPGSSINILADDAISRSYIPNVRVSDFQKMLDRYRSRHGKYYVEIPSLTEELSQLKPNTILARKYNLKTGKTLWVIADNAIMPQEKGLMGACGKSSVNANPSQGYLRFLFYADSVQLLSR